MYAQQNGLCMNCLDYSFRHVEDLFSAMQNAGSHFENSQIPVP